MVGAPLHRSTRRVHIAQYRTVRRVADDACCYARGAAARLFFSEVPQLFGSLQDLLLKTDSIWEKHKTALLPDE